jgi:uncharacterized lipoprotein YbaY
MRTAILLLAVAVALIAPAPAHADGEGPVPEVLTLTGTVASNDARPLPRDALLTVDLEDVSRATRRRRRSPRPRSSSTVSRCRFPSRWCIPGPR